MSYDLIKFHVTLLQYIIFHDVTILQYIILNHATLYYVKLYDIRLDYMFRERDREREREREREGRCSIYSLNYTIASCDLSVHA